MELNASDLAEGQTETLDWTGPEKIQSLAEMSMPLFHLRGYPLPLHRPTKSR
jgi:hypothetical protein